MKKRSEIFCDRLDAMKTPIDLWFTKAMEELDGMQNDACNIANKLRSQPRDLHASGAESATIPGDVLDRLADCLDGKCDRQYCVKIPAEKLALLLGCRHGAIVRRCLPTGAETAFSFVVLNPEDD